MDVKIAHIHGGKDPADIIKANPKAWAKIVKDSKSFVDFMLDTLSEKGLDDKTFRKKVVSSVLPYVRLVKSSVEQTHFIKKIADKTGIQESALWDDLKKIPEQKETLVPEAAKKERKTRLEAIERKLVGLIYSKKFFDGAADRKERLRKVVGEERGKEIEGISEDEKGECILEAEITYETTDAGKEFEILLLNLEEEYEKKKLEVLMAKLHKSEKGVDKAQSEGFLKEIQSVSQRIQEIKKLQNPL